MKRMERAAFKTTTPRTPASLTRTFDPLPRIVKAKPERQSHVTACASSSAEPAVRTASAFPPNRAEVWRAERLANLQALAKFGLQGAQVTGSQGGKGCHHKFQNLMRPVLIVIDNGAADRIRIASGEHHQYIPWSQAFSEKFLCLYQCWNVEYLARGARGNRPGNLAG